MPIKTIEEKILEFDKKFPCLAMDYDVDVTDEVKDFLSTSLTSLRSQIIEEIEGLVSPHRESEFEIIDKQLEKYMDGWNSCHSEFLAKLKEYEKI